MKLKTTKVSKEKLKRFSELEDLMKNSKTILIASIKNIPASQLQEIVKNLRSKAVVKVPKKSLILRAVDSSGIKEIQGLKEKIQDNTAVLFSSVDSFDLAAELINRKKPSRAKAGQISPFDIEVEAGPTDLAPGPAITELGALGIQIQIDKGKISIKESKVIVKEGQVITSAASDVMTKLGIRPFFVGFTPLAAFDRDEKKVYLSLNIDQEGTINTLKEAYSKALPFAVEIGYATDETISFLIGKAGIQERALEKFLGKKTEEKKEESEEDNKEKKDKGEDQTQQNSQEENK